MTTAISNNLIATTKPKILTNFLEKLSFFRKKHIDTALHYLSGLWHTLTRFNIETLYSATMSGEQSYQQLRYFINDADWDEAALNERRLQFLEHDVRTQTRDEGELIIDDSGIKKYGKHTDGVYYQHYGAEGINTDCKVVVTSHYADDTKDFPVDAEAYYKDDGKPRESKLDLACSMIDRSVKRQIRFSWISFDRWFCTSQVIRKVEEHHKYFVSKLKSNRSVVYRGERMNASSLVTAAATFSAHKDTPVDLGIVTLKDLGEYRVVVFKGECFVTNNFDVAPETVVARYQQRWTIEEFYKQSKENLSFGQFQVRNGLAIMRHWMLVFLAHSFYVHCKLKGVFSKIATATVRTLGDFRRMMQNLNFIRAAKEHTNVLMAQLGLKTIN
jgi:SRSO17 transposase